MNTDMEHVIMRRYSFQGDQIIKEESLTVDLHADSEYFQIIFGNELLELSTPTVLSVVREVTRPRRLRRALARLPQMEGEKA